MNNSSGGFAMMMSVLMFAAVILIIVFTSVTFTTGQFSQSLALESHEQARASAESCAEIALLNRIEDTGYLGNETVNVAGNNCTIRPIAVGTPTVITTQAIVSGYVYRLRVELMGNNPPVVSKWQRVASF